MRGYVVVFEGDDATGWSAYAPDVPGFGAAGDTREETESLARHAMAGHLALLAEMGEPVPAPSEVSGVMVLDPATA